MVDIVNMFKEGAKDERAPTGPVIVDGKGTSSSEVQVQGAGAVLPSKGETSEKEKGQEKAGQRILRGKVTASLVGSIWDVKIQTEPGQFISELDLGRFRKHLQVAYSLFI